jgi:hypothetical protein
VRSNFSLATTDYLAKVFCANRNCRILPILEPTTGIEPVTSSLPRTCSAD